MTILSILLNGWTLMAVVIFVTYLTSSSLVTRNKFKPESFYYYVFQDRHEPNEPHPHPSEVEIVSVLELAGTNYGEAIGAELIYQEIDNL
jgi:hypothetical protein